MTTTTITTTGAASPVLASAMHTHLAGLRARLGVVRPRDRRTRRLGPPVHRLDLLHATVERETFEHVVTWLRSRRSDGTAREYADDVRHWTLAGRELCGTEPWYLGSITSDVIPVWRGWATEELRLGPRRVNRLASSLTSLIDWVKYRTRQELVHPITRYDRFRVDPNDESSMTPILEIRELQAVLGACTTARQAFAVSLIYTLAGRVSECCDASTADLSSESGACVLTLRRKGGKTVPFPLPSELCGLGAAAWQGSTSTSLLLDDDGRPMDRHGVDRLLNRLGRQAGVLPGRDLTPHVLRGSKLTTCTTKARRPTTSADSPTTRTWSRRCGTSGAVPTPTCGRSTPRRR
ncbi:tyrosine-type recombinase/integrase [Streptomyces sp. NPDC001781]